MSDVAPAEIPVISVRGSTVPQTTAIQSTGGNIVPSSGKINPPAAASSASTSGQFDAKKKSTDVFTKPAASDGTSLQSRVDYLNKSLNDSGRPNQFRIAPQSGGQTIQEINPANGAVIGQFAAADFPALARSLGVSGALVDSQA